MKLLKLAISSALCLLALAGCMQREEFTPGIDGGIPIHVDGEISQEATKVSANGFEMGDALGLYAVNYTDGNQTPGTLQTEGNQADHVKYILSENGWNPVRPVYYKDVNTNVDIYTFYPYGEPKSVTEYTFEVSKDQSTAKKNGILGGYEASDFLWGKVENVTPTESKIKVTLGHKMAGAEVILTEGSGFEEGVFESLEKSVMVSGTTRKATINLATGTVTPIGSAQSTGIVMAPQSDGTFRAVVVPQSINASTTMFTITIDGIPYRFVKDAAFEYTGGKLSTFTIKVNKKSHTGEYEFILTDTQIVDWKEDRNTHEGEARQYYCVTVSEPGTLGRLIKADKKNPDKIRNLKVSGTISDSDFYFMRDSMEILEAVNLKESKVVYTRTFSGWNNGSYYTETKTYKDIIPENAFSEKKTLFYFTFPEIVKEIGSHAFYNSSISGALVIPDDVTIINYGAFRGTNITSLTLSPVLEKINEYAFSECKSLSGTLTFPVTTTYIGTYAFGECSFSGQLILPENLEYLGSSAFNQAGKFTGDLRIPDKISKLGDWTFHNSSFTGTLDLNNVTGLGEWCFYASCFQGELIIPEGVTDIPYYCFFGNYFTTIIFPSSLKTIGERSFSANSRLTTPLVFPEGMVSIGKESFTYCSQLQGVDFPSTLQSIQSQAFDYCFSINSIISRSVETPTVASNAFSGVAKDNFTLEVPENAVVRYQTDPVWGEFRRISAHHDFSISRPLARALNGEKSRKYTLRAPANHTWSIESKPEWVTVTPSSGTGKTEVTVTISEMTETDIISDALEYQYINKYGGTSNGYLDGRSGEVVFLLDDKDYRTSLKLEQYDYEYGDGDVYTLQIASKGEGINIVFMGDCYDAKDIATGTYLKDIQEAYGYFFDVEPYKAYKDYFNVYAVFGLSDDSGVGTVNTVKDAKFGSQYSLAGIAPDFETSYEYAAKADQDLDPAKTLIVMVENTTEYGGITYMWGDGTAIAVCPKSDDAYPYDFRGLVQHEAAGHGFGKLADEYIYTNGFISACGCRNPHTGDFMAGKSLGWYRNLELSGDPNTVGWSHLIFHPDYSNVVDIYEGGYFHTRGVFRSEPTSCMNNNIPYFSAISRQAIVERIMEYAGVEFSLESFYENDSNAVGSTGSTAQAASVPSSLRYQGQQYPPVYMGDKPNFRR